MKKEVPSFAVSRLHRRPVLLAAVLDQGPIWVTGSEVGSSGPDIVGRNGCYSVKKVTTSSIGALDGAPWIFLIVFDDDTPMPPTVAQG